MIEMVLSFFKSRFEAANDLIFVGDSLKDKERAEASQITFVARLGLFKKEDFLKTGLSCEAISDLLELKLFY